MARVTLQPERHHLGAIAFAARMAADLGEKEALLRRMGLAR